MVGKLSRGSSLRRKVLDINSRGAEFVSLTERLDTSSPGGRLIFHVFAAIAEFEREMIVERTKAGLAAARARGRQGGRPRKWSDKDILLMLAPDRDIRAICERFDISRSSLYRIVGPAGKPQMEVAM